MITQGGAVTNRRIHQSELPAIQARAQLLPYYQQQKRDQAYQDKTYELQRQGQDQTAQHARESLDLQRDQADMQNKQADKAARAARMQLGMETGLGIGRLTDDAPKAQTSTEQANNLADSITSKGVDATAQDGAAASDPGVWGNTKNALTSGNTWASTAFGALAGPELGDAALKGTGMGKRERRMLGGAVAGGTAAYLSSGGDFSGGGDLYSTALSAGLSSLGGLF
ncbi:hypothetical protein [Desulfocurvibacter africanus]|uniref:Uncharacterized protein n=1 Tax=Desulfocurvibacter africanus subsp. africanus str. Walvis Bay TaxID=690850 RepID=F3YXE9_DESAF|nr:hypothetical protein [Desulfocurvibacter africanus]EGJ51726.1 hypothetical protein Desaf_3440 [Desulfocurvibacter africanus subsp. africanus str. Walvis Bay]